MKAGLDDRATFRSLLMNNEAEQKLLLPPTSVCFSRTIQLLFSLIENRTKPTKKMRPIRCHRGEKKGMNAILLSPVIPSKPDSAPGTRLCSYLRPGRS